MIHAVIEKAEKAVGKNVPFEFWKLLEESEEAMKTLSPRNDGEKEGGVVVKGVLSLGKGSLVKSGTRIEGNVYIGKNCVIGPNAYLRNGTIIADDCFVGTSEIKNSIVLSGSKIPHFSYAGDSLIGKNCNLGAGTKIANLRHDNSTVKVQIGGGKKDSGRRKLGALIFNNVKTGINSCINCGAVIEEGSLVPPNELRK